VRGGGGGVEVVQELGGGTGHEEVAHLPGEVGLAAGAAGER
jgi:hypothetical protein